VEENLLSLGSADKPKPTVTDNSLDSPMHGHLGQRVGNFAPGRKRTSLPAREVSPRTHRRNCTNTQAPCQRPTGGVPVPCRESRHSKQVISLPHSSFPPRQVSSQPFYGSGSPLSQPTAFRLLSPARQSSLVTGHYSLDRFAAERLEGRFHAVVNLEDGGETGDLQ
jgi:hypothetical protein